MASAVELRQKKSQPQTLALSDASISDYLTALDNWTLQDGKIVKTFRFKNYYETLAFVNAIAYMTHAEDHHPDLHVTYNHCTVSYSTHSVNAGKGGLSENDFICAAKVDTIFAHVFA
jgi:4a-hydroxytetrahydrobiopterin dehydratase